MKSSIWIALHFPRHKWLLPRGERKRYPLSWRAHQEKKKKSTWYSFSQEKDPNSFRRFPFPGEDKKVKKGPGQRSHTTEIGVRVSEIERQCHRSSPENNSIKPPRHPGLSIALLSHLALHCPISHTQWESDLFSCTCRHFQTSPCVI
jgi:hypothetical protein